MTENMLKLAKELEEQGANLRVLILACGDVDTQTPMGKMMFTVMVALVQMELDIKFERNRDSAAKHRASDGDLGGRREKCGDESIHGAARDIAGGVSASVEAKHHGISRTTLYRRAKTMGMYF